jgi:hypothetical protein
MARLSIIPPKLNQSVMDKSAEGWSASKISEWLATEHQVISEPANIGNLIRKLSQERKEVAKAAYAKAVSESANTDVAILGEMIDGFRNAVLEYMEKDPAKAAKIAETLIKFQDRRMKVSGVDIGHSDDDKILEQLLEKLGK